MPQLDIIHDFVKNALIKDGWLVTEPYVIKYGKTTLYADLSAERIIGAERDGQKLVVEVKSFVGASKIQDLKEALGQYDIYLYRSTLSITKNEINSLGLSWNISLIKGFLW
jgi:hypothetical protein